MNKIEETNNLQEKKTLDEIRRKNLYAIRRENLYAIRRKNLTSSVKKYRSKRISSCERNEKALGLCELVWVLWGFDTLWDF